MIMDSFSEASSFKTRSTSASNSGSRAEVGSSNRTKSGSMAKARDGDALLTRRQLFRVMIQFVGQADFGQQVLALAVASVFESFQNRNRAFDDIFQYRQMREEV